ncbi:hypothetical protein ABPG72_015073 [Tetrahymena utriculariae]
MSFQASDSAFVGLGPIPLRDNQMQSPDQFEDILRKMKNQQEQNKLQLKEKELKDQKNLIQQREQVKRLMEKNSNTNFTYDYDGKIILAKKGSSKNIVNQENTVGVQYKIGTTISVVKKINVEQPQQVIPKIIQGKDQYVQVKNQGSSIHSQSSSQSNQLQSDLTSQPNSYEMMLENIKPSQGVIFKGAKGEVKAGEGYSNQQSQFDFYDTQKNPNDIKRMTKKDYEEFIKTSGNYSRNDTYKPRRYTTNNLNQNRAENNFEDILDGINYSQIQPIEEQTEEENLTQQDKRLIQNNIIKGVSPLTQNKSSFKLAGFNSIQRQGSDRVNNKQSNQNIQIFDNPYAVPQQNANYQSIQRGSTIFKNSSQIQQPKKNKAGNIQVADQEKLRNMLLN